MPRSRGRSAPAKRAPAPASRSAPAPAANRAPAPAPQQPPQAMAGQPQQPGMFQRVAETAAGVAAGHVMANAVTGMMSGGGEAAPAPAAEQATPANAGGFGNAAPQGPCGYEYKQFMHCMQETNNDLSYCQQYNDMFNFCRKQNGI